nr:hypothetical protein [Tanacetum cinerariifolium]
MYDNIPFEIQSEIIRRLNVKKLLQFRSISKQWKSLIDDPKFIKNYHVNHPNPQHHLLLCYQLDTSLQTYSSIIDNNTFPKQKFPLTAPESLHSFRGVILLNSVDGLLFFCDLYASNVYSNTERLVILNPAIRKSVDIEILLPEAGYIVAGFGVSHDTSDPKLVKIYVDKLSSLWVVEIFTLSTRVWKIVYIGAPFKSCTLSWHHVFVDGVIYFHAFDDGVRFNIVISFDLKSDMFGEVSLPERLVHTPDLNVTKIYDPTVLGFRNTGEVVMELQDADNYDDSSIGVYEPLSGHIYDVGSNGKLGSLSVRSHVESLLLLDDADSIIH